MKLQTAIAALATLTLSGCAQIWPLPGGSQPIREELSFEGNKIRTKSVAIVVPASRSSVVLEWQLPKGDAAFAPDGIVIEGAVVFPPDTEPDLKARQQPVADTLRIDRKQRSNFNCSRSEDRLKFSCTSDQLVPGIYKYTIRVQRGSEVFKLDPPIVIMRALN